jgi:hypothetical protein
MNGKAAELMEGHVAPRIIMMRGQKVVLDSDLARLYGVETFRFNEAVKRNRNRFPPDFAFQLTHQEFSGLISQIAISSSGHGGVRKLPWVFTEHGAVMAANLLRSDRAVQMSVFVVRAFIKMREHLVSTRELALRLAEIEKQLVIHDSALVDLFQKIQPLLLPPDDPPTKPIGFSP